MNINCVICSDLFTPVDSVFTTPCGHVFHHACLIQWLERKKDCPQCRQRCTERNIFRIYFNTTSNNDSSANSENLIDTIDNLTLKVREYELKMKSFEEQKKKLEDSVNHKEKKLKKLDLTVLQNNQVISTMKHEIDMLTRNRASYKTIEVENTELKSKINLLQTIECVLTASQKEIDDIVRQNLSNKDLAVMVGSLRRELNIAEMRKNELRKQLQTVRNELRAEQEQKRELQDELSKLESENNLMKNRIKRVRDDQNSVPGEENVDTPEIIKKSRTALLQIDSQNTPSPLNQEEFKKRIQTIQESESPYFKVKKSSIALACVLKNPSKVELKPSTSSQPSDSVSKLSIFKKPRIGLSNGNKPKLHSNLMYNGVGGTSKILLSDLKTSTLKK